MIFHLATGRRISLERRTTQPRHGTPATQRHDLQPANMNNTEKVTIKISSSFLSLAHATFNLPWNPRRLRRQLRLHRHIQSQEWLESLVVSRLHPSAPSNLGSSNRCNKTEERKTWVPGNYCANKNLGENLVLVVVVSGPTHNKIIRPTWDCLRKRRKQSTLCLA